jgi:hypothetical protein
MGTHPKRRWKCSQLHGFALRQKNVRKLLYVGRDKFSPIKPLTIQAIEKNALRKKISDCLIN